MSDPSASAPSKSVTATAKKPMKKLRPARKQVRVDQIDKTESVQTGKEYNIWYNKWAGGDREDSYGQKTHSQSRCIIARDSGYTRADAMGTKYCCLFFARGCCPLGHECKYLHRLPLPTHILPDTALDCFGREKHADYRDDMGGVGSFGRQNRTLYVGKIQEGATKADTEEMLRRHFGEWGEIVKMNILYNRGVAFLTFANEMQAQFAREAMANQSMDGDEILNVRWATEDPNPTSVVEERKRLEEIGKEGITSKIDVHSDLIEAVQAVKTLEDGDLEDLYPIPDPLQEDDEPASKRARIEGPPSASQGGLFGGDAMENIKYFADLARQQVQAAQQKQKEEQVRKVQPVKPSASALVGGYGSDSDEE